MRKKKLWLQFPIVYSELRREWLVDSFSHPSSLLRSIDSLSSNLLYYFAKYFFFPSSNTQELTHAGKLTDITTLIHQTGIQTKTNERNNNKNSRKRHSNFFRPCRSSSTLFCYFFLGLRNFYKSLSIFICTKRVFYRIVH